MNTYLYIVKKATSLTYIVIGGILLHLLLRRLESSSNIELSFLNSTTLLHGSLIIVLLHKCKKCKLRPALSKGAIFTWQVYQVSITVLLLTLFHSEYVSNLVVINTFLAAMYEELLIRKWFIVSLMAKVNHLTALVISIIMFALLHIPSLILKGQIDQAGSALIEYCFSGLNYGLSYLLTGSVLVPTLIHFISNIKVSTYDQVSHSHLIEHIVITAPIVLVLCASIFDDKPLLANKK